jgi:hypothetical protein
MVQQPIAPKDLGDLLTQAARARRLARAIPNDPMGLRLVRHERSWPYWRSRSPPTSPLTDDLAACVDYDVMASCAVAQAGLARAWFKSAVFWVTEAYGNRRSVRAGFGSKGCPVREAANPPRVSLESGLPGLKWPEAQQRQPMRMSLAGHQFARALAAAFGPSAAHEAPMVQEEPQQAQV